MAQIDCLADTSAIVLLLRGDDAKAKAILESRQFAITFITLAELSLGILKAAKREEALRAVTRALLNMTVFVANQVTTQWYAHIFYDLQKAGTMIPVNDVWIAAIAMQQDLPLIARDKHFLSVHGLRVIEC